MFGYCDMCSVSVCILGTDMCCSRYVTGNGSFKPSATGGVCCILKVVCPKVHEPRVTNYCAIKDQGEFRREKREL